jgi:hypothetical protein
MTVFACWHHTAAVDNPTPGSFGFTPLQLISGIKGSLDRTLAKMVQQGRAGRVANCEEHKEAGEGQLFADRFLVAHAVARSGVDGCYGVSFTDWDFDRRNADDPFADHERARAQAIGPIVKFVEANAYCPFTLAQIASDPNRYWARYSQAIIRHAERSTAFWRSASGSPLPVRRWISDRNATGELLDRWWFDETRKLLAALGGHTVLLQGNGAGDQPTAWTTHDLTFAQTFAPR